MNTIEKFKKVGICFRFRRDVETPQIPYVQDVFYVMQLSDKREYYGSCHGNHARWYFVNTMLVVAAVGSEVFCMEPYDEAKARKLIAKAIVDLCPEEAKCFLNTAFFEAKLASGEEFLVPRDVKNRIALRQACPCSACREAIPEHRRFDDGISLDEEDTLDD